MAFKRPAPTKANMFNLQKDLRFATEGAELLHQKRDVLVMELMNIVSGFMDTEEQLQEKLGRSFDHFFSATLGTGDDIIQRSVSVHQPDLELEVQERSVMGISLPEVRISSGQELDDPGMIGTTTALDSTISDLRDALDILARHIETVTSIWRLATEIEKTQKRINALENVFIPEAKQNIKWIKSVMEENEREELFRRKLLKSESA